MHGAEAFDQACDDGAGSDMAEVLANAAWRTLHSGGVLASVPEQGAPLATDYDRGWWFLRCFPGCFPHGTGGRPEGMSEQVWMQLLMHRWPPDQFAGNPYFVQYCYNILQRHMVNTNAYVQLLVHRSDMERIADITLDQLNDVVKLTMGLLRGTPATATQKHLHAAGQALLRAMRCAGLHLPGSPASFRQLLSTSNAMWAMFGAWTMMLNLNPSEFDAQLTFQMAGHAYGFATDGTPDQHRPDAMECWRIIAANPVAVADFFRAFLRAFCDVFLGWPPGAEQQQTADCAFGTVTAYIFKHETSSRGALHSHSIIVQPFLQPDQLETLATDDNLRHAALQMMDSMICQRLSPGAHRTRSQQLQSTQHAPAPARLHPQHTLTLTLSLRIRRHPCSAAA